MGSLSKIAEELLIHYTLHQYPYSDNEWVSIDQAFDQLKQDPRLAMHFIKTGRPDRRCWDMESRFDQFWPVRCRQVFGGRLSHGILPKPNKDAYKRQRIWFA